MTNLELADKLQKEAGHFSGAQDLVGMLWDAGAALRNLHTENTALRVTEDNLRQELQECQDQRRAAFRRIEEIDATRGQPPVKAELLCVCGCEWQWENRSWELVAGPYPSHAKQPLTDEQINQMWSDAHNDTSTMSLIHVLARAIEAAHNIGEKK